MWRQLAIGTNWPVLLAVALLSITGLVTVWYDVKPDLTSGGSRHLAYILCGILCMAAFQAVNYQLIGRYAWAFYLVALAPLSRLLRFTVNDGSSSRVCSVLVPTRAGVPARGETISLVMPRGVPQRAVLAKLYV